MYNHLKGQTSPYLLQHVNNPVDWYSWCNEAFEKASKEDKPIFLSIGYSTCHWCHVMAHESFEDEETANILNNYFVSIKVDKEERPDIDSIYMKFCQAFTGNGGWPTSIFMTSDGKPFYGGTYFPKESLFNLIGFKDLLMVIHDNWINNRSSLLQLSENIINKLNNYDIVHTSLNEDLIQTALIQFNEDFDEEYGGFSQAPKFPLPHNLLFMLQQFQKNKDSRVLQMVEKTLIQMYRGGIFDHIGGGFSRYSTDRYYLVPHFEKMLYDNALLILTYSTAYSITKNELYKCIAKKTADYLIREMKSKNGGFFSAQDADSDSEEGKYYVFTPDEITNIIGKKDSDSFCEYFNITKKGNFKGKSIPNLLFTNVLNKDFEMYFPIIDNYRKKRTTLHTDDKILTFWNSLAIVAFCSLYRTSRDESFLEEAIQIQKFIEKNLYDNGTLYVSWRINRNNIKGFLDDYASYSFALLSLYDSTLNQDYLNMAKTITNNVIKKYFDSENGGFYLSGSDNETLIMKPKESHDGAIPSGNSIMTYVLVKLYYILQDERIENILKKQLSFMSNEAEKYPSGYSMFLSALSTYLDPPLQITIIRGKETFKELPLKVSLNTIIRIYDSPCNNYKLKNNNTTFYICKGHTCYPPLNKDELYNQLKN